MRHGEEDGRWWCPGGAVLMRPVHPIRARRGVGSDGKKNALWVAYLKT